MTEETTKKDGLYTDAYWQHKATKLLVGRRIVAARYMTKEEAREYGFSKRGILFKLDTGLIVQVQSDDEGNDSGVLTFQSQDGKEYEILPSLR